ncbi:hypothetical protein PMI22_04728 [Pseudomonas sp. GM21]|nr:hypothetical protein PMI22_04728 [Pseudomonas sp. GM21]
MTAVTITVIAVVISAFTMIANGPAGVITGEPIAVAATVRAAGVIGTAVTRVTASSTAAMATANATAVTTTSVSVTAATAVPATVTTTTATILRKGGVHDRQVSRQ